MSLPLLLRARASHAITCATLPSFVRRALRRVVTLDARRGDLRTPSHVPQRLAVPRHRGEHDVRVGLERGVGVHQRLAVLRHLSLLAQMPQNVLECLAQFCLAPLKISLPPGQLALEQELASVRRS